MHVCICACVCVCVSHYRSTNILENTESRGGSTQAPLGLNSRAVPNDNPELMSKTAPEVGLCG